jgi:dTDP-4-dehydrorhamnose reductase
MAQKSIAIVGFGDLGEPLSDVLRASQWRCFGLRRNALAVPAGVEGLAIDLQHAPSLRVLADIRPDVVMIALTPTERSAEGYVRGFSNSMRAIVEGLAGHQPQQAFFVSSTRVYAEAAGGWVDESATLARDDPFAGAIIRAEDALLEALPGALVLRAAGLYGNVPGHLLKRVAAGRLTPRQPLRFGNRVHRDDVAGFIAHTMSHMAERTIALQGPEPGVAFQDPTHVFAQRVINLVDQAPVPLQETEAWLCAQLGQSYIPDNGDPGAPPSGKRVRSTGLAASDYSLQYPDYRAGYAPALHEWHAGSER